MGRTTLGDEIAAGRISVEGIPRMTRAFPKWMSWSHFAPASLRRASA